MSLDPHDPSNAVLLGHVRPADWVSPSPRTRYDLVVIGGGTAGLVAALGAAGVGAHVALVERDRLGGDCLNTGCVPSKALLAAAHLAAAAGHGAAPPPHGPADGLAFASAMARVRQARATLAPHDGAVRAAAHGVHVFFGGAAFATPDTIAVGDLHLRFRRAVVATGARPARPDIDGLDDPAVLTSESLFERTTQPQRLAVVGGGAAGCELAQAFARLGTVVHLLETAPRVLPREDADAAAVVRGALERDGVRVTTSATLHHLARHDGALRATLTRGSVADALDVDAVLLAAGRTPNTAGLGLDVAGVRTDPAGRVVVDDFLRSSNARIFAAGDVCLPWQFTHAADASARLVVRNALFAGRGRVSGLVVPRVTYTDPELATVGLTVEDAAAAGVPITRFEVPFSTVDRAVTDGRTDGFARILTRAGRDRIVGATVVGARAGDIMGEVVLAMQAGIGMGQLATIVRAYPTYSGAIGRAADAYNRTRVTPRVAWLLRTWLEWSRRVPGA